ncbi:MAG: response regulator transcription factor [Actinobacteria bacterium]|nr:response regulator transcription factor [Actinomycetota bacterium]
MPGPGPSATIALCIEDGALLDDVCGRLVADRHQVLPTTGAGDALRLCRHGRPDLLVLDLGLPDEAGPGLLQRIRSADPADRRLDPDLPVIGLAARGGPEVCGLDLGVDDLVQKPFAHEELRRRIVAILRRRHSRGEAPVLAGELLVDPGRRLVMVGEREVSLSRKEFTLLRVLVSDPTRVFSKGELLRDAWGPELPPGRTRTLDSHASRLRRKLDPEGARFVLNQWGVGYRLLPREDGRAGR